MSKAITWKLVQVDKSRIKINPNNPKIFDEKGFARLEKLRAKYGTIFDGILNSDFSMIDGHSRLKQSPDGKGNYFIPSRKLSEKDYKELNALFDLAKAGSPDTLLIEEMFGDEFMVEWEIDSQKKPEAEEDDFDGKPPVKPITVLGDLYELNDHRVLCQDSCDSRNVSELMNGRKSDMVFTDPPYNINYGNIKHPKFRQREIANDNMSGEKFGDFCDAFVSNIAEFSKGCVYIAGAPGPDGRIMFMAADKALKCSTVIVWNKDQFTLGRGKYQNKYEPIWFGWVDNGTSFYGDRTQTNVWDIARPKASEDHPTMKPVELVAKAINHASRKNDIVLDLFLGSGTTIIASDQLERICYGQECDTSEAGMEGKYCDVIVARYVKYKRDTGGSLVIKKNGRQLSDKEIQKYLDNTNAEK